MELFAAIRIDPNSEEFKAGMKLGQMFAMTICGVIPLIQGIKSKHPIMGMMGAFLTAGTAWFLGCIGGLPIAFVLSLLIRSLPSPSPDEDAYRAEVERQRDRGWKI